VIKPMPHRARPRRESHVGTAASAVRRA
jgi:hypothetical protein